MMELKDWYTATLFQRKGPQVLLFVSIKKMHFSRHGLERIFGSFPQHKWAKQIHTAPTCEPPKKNAFSRCKAVSTRCSQGSGTHVLETSGCFQPSSALQSPQMLKRVQHSANPSKLYRRDGPQRRGVGAPLALPPRAPLDKKRYGGHERTRGRLWTLSFSSLPGSYQK